ncbi:MAG: glycosyltransferase family 39 protein [Chloroflexota bacterium]|nr:glycosyltransferase family 39 protein [Chloroflexota bacterium]
MSQLPPATQKQDLRAAALALGALLLGLFSFFWANRHPEYIWDGPILLISAALLLFFAVRRASPVTNSAGAEVQALTQQIRNPLAEVSTWRIVIFGVSVMLTLLLLRALAALQPPVNYDGAVLLWLAAIVSFLLAVAPPVSRPREEWSLWWEVHRNVLLILGAIVLVAFALRVSHIGTIPATVGGDEGSQGLEALRVISGEIRNPFTTGWLGVPSMSFFYNSITIRLLGPTITALRLPWAIVGGITVLTTFWLVTRLRGLTLGLMTAALLATYHYHIHFSRLGSNQIADPFFVSLALLFLYRARDRNSPLDWAMVGITVGLAQYFYAGARLTMVVVGLCLLHFFWTSRERWEVLRDLVGGALTMVGAAVITAAPMIHYAIRFPNDYNARLNQVGWIQSGIFAAEVESKGLLTALWDQFHRAFLAFNVYPDRTPWYGSPEPLMDGMWGTLFMLGLLYTTFRLFTPRGDRRLFPLVIWWWSGMILGGVLTESPPSTQRLIVLAPPACFFIAVILLRVGQHWQEAFGDHRPRELAALLTIVILGLSASSIHWYFGEFTPMRCNSGSTCYGSLNGEIATSLGKYLAREMESEQQVVMLGPPQIYVGFGTIPYLEPRASEGIDVHEPLSSPPTSDSLGLEPDKRPLFVATPARRDELLLAEEAFPGGRRVNVKDRYGKILFSMYVP